MRAIASLRALMFYEQSVGYFASKNLHMKIHELKLAYLNRRVKAHIVGVAAYRKKMAGLVWCARVARIAPFLRPASAWGWGGAGLAHCRAFDRPVRGLART